MQNRADKFLFIAKQDGKNKIVASVDGNNFVNNYYHEATLILREERLKWNITLMEDLWLKKLLIN